MPNTDQSKREIKDIFGDDFEIKVLKEEGQFEGYGSFFDNIDSYNDIVVKGAFVKSLRKLGNPALLWQHDSRMPIGVYKAVKEDETGLYVRGELNLKVQGGIEAYELLKQGAIKGLSIGYSSVLTEYDEKKQVRTIKEANLYEISIVTFPANSLATVTGVKSLPQNEREFESFLREAGFSRNDAKAIVAKGFRALQRADDLCEADVADAVKEIGASADKLIQLLKGK